MKHTLTSSTTILLSAFIIGLCTIKLQAQTGNVGIGTTTPDGSAVLEIKSDSLGILIPRLSAAARDAIDSPATGLMVFVNDDSTFYFYAGSSWVPVGNNSRVLSDADGDTKIQVEEGPDDDTIRFDMGGTEHFRMAKGRLEVLNTGGSVFIGDGAGAKDNLGNNLNVAIGDSALSSNITGSSNVASGWGALYSNTEGFGNVASGFQALYSNTNGYANVASGLQAMHSNTMGGANVASGYQALYSNKGGVDNVASGFQAMYSNTMGGANVASGSLALYSNTKGRENVASGWQALYSNTGGIRNVASGYQALYSNTDGFSNVASGYRAGYNSSGDSSVFIGNEAGFFETAGNRLYIENSRADSVNALIYGEFDNDWLRINGRLSPMEGITDADGDTKIQIEESPDEDIIRFDLGGIEYFAMDSGRLAVSNTGHSIFVGEGAGANDDFSDNWNIFIGDSTGHEVTTGNRNVAVGYRALRQGTASGTVALGHLAFSSIETSGFNTGVGLAAGRDLLNGERNTLLGNNAMGSSTTGSRNVAIGNWAARNYNGNGSVIIGNEAGRYATGDSLLIIENTDKDSSEALIYGNFGDDMLSINGRLGIETQAPTELLHVSGGNGLFDRGGVTNGISRELVMEGARSGGLSPYAQIKFNNYDINTGDTTYTGSEIRAHNYNAEDAGDLRFYTSDTIGSMQLGLSLRNAKAGVAVESPASAMHIYGGAGTSSANGLTIENGDVADDRTVFYHNSGNDLVIRKSTKPNQLVLADDGTVGIGEEDPTARLHIAAINNSSTPFLVKNDTVSNFGVRINSGHSRVVMDDAAGNTNVVLHTNGNSYFNGGNVGIGTTTPPDALSVTDLVAFSYISKFDNTAIHPDADGIAIRIGPDANPTATNEFLIFEDGNGTQVGSVSGDGSGGTSFNTTSDMRLKDNIRAYTEGLNLVMEMKPSIYERKSNPGVDQVGFIAQELYEVFPQVVAGTPDQPEEKPMMVNYAGLTPVLVAAIQEQQEVILTNQRLSASNQRLSASNEMTNQRLLASNQRLSAEHARMQELAERLMIRNEELVLTNQRLSASNAELSKASVGMEERLARLEALITVDQNKD